MATNRGERPPLSPILLVFLAVLALEGGFLVWSLDRFHREVRTLTEETVAMRRAVERMQTAPSPVSASTTAPAPTPPAPAPTVPQGDGIVIGGMGEPSTLNRYAGSDGSVRTVCNYIHDGLITLDSKTLEPMPCLAESFEIERGGESLLFRLRPGVLWSDGSPFSVDDVLFTRSVLADPGVPGAGMSSVMSMVERVETPGGGTIRFVLRNPSFRALIQIGTGFRILCASWWKQEILQLAKAEGRTTAPSPGEPGFAKYFLSITEPGPGTGPYEFDATRSWKRGSRLTLFRNKTSWWKRAFPDRWNLSTVSWRFFMDEVPHWQELVAGRIDLLTTDGDRWRAAKDADPRIADRFRFVRYDHPGLGHVAILWNCRKPPFDDARVRRAMTMLIDRATMVGELFKDAGPIATCPFKPGTPEYSTDLEPLPFDPSAARRELAAAGWTDKDGDGWLDRDGQDLVFALKIPSQPEEYRQIADLIAPAMKAAGVQMIVHSLDWGTFRAGVCERHDFAAACLQLSHSDVLVDPFDRYHSSEDRPNGSNYCGLKDQRVDDLLQQGRAEMDRTKRVTIYHQLNRRLHELQPHTLIRHPLVSVVLSSRFRNAEINARGLVPEEWFVPPEKQLRNR